MGKVKCFKIDGLELLFYSNDHLPEHIHIRKSGKWEIRVYFLLCSEKRGLDFTVKWSDDVGISSKEKKQILKLVLENRTKLLEEWNNRVCKENQ